MRHARVYGARTGSEVSAYLPDNYHVIGTNYEGDRLVVLIEGEDKAGWTMADYVAPRLASGLMTCRESTPA